MSNEAKTMNQKSKRTLTPKQRFPEFRDAPEWQEKPLSEMSERIVEKVGDAALTPVSITAGQGFVSQVEKFGRDISGVQYKNYILLRKGDFAYNKGNSKSYPQGCVRRLKEFDQAAVPSAFVSFRLHVGYVPEFFEGLFEKNVHGRQLIKFITSSARSDGLLNISPNEFFSVNLPMPQNPAEQQKIAECLSSLDGLIAAEGRKLEALQDHKRGLMQQLFPKPGQTQPRLRFPEFRDEGEWGEKTLGKLSIIIRGGSPRPIDSYLTKNSSGLNWLKIGDVDKDAKYIDSTEEKVIPEALSKTREVKPGDFILSNSMSFGRPYLLKMRTCIHDGWIAVTNITESIHHEYLYYAIMSPRSQLFFEDQAAGGGVRNLNKDIIKSLPVGYPKITEQQKIADCLTSLDDRIAAQAAKVDALKTHKRGLMKQLFPGP
jgi:type I restriction enzyme, S subunit